MQILLCKWADSSDTAEDMNCTKNMDNFKNMSSLYFIHIG